MRQLLGTKIGMTRVFSESGDQVPVTVIQAGPCPVVQVKTKENDGYDAVVIGYGATRKKLVNKPLMGRFEKAGIEPQKHLREMRLEAPEEIAVGDTWTVESFTPGDKVTISGISKGKGFQGGMRRHGFSGAQKTHGQSDRWRAPGSIGQSSYPSRVFKGMRMAGRMGGDKVTLRKVIVVDVDTEKNLILVRGAVPGTRNGLVVIRG
jgi:large subunit ribosomal protein L3